MKIDMHRPSILGVSASLAFASVTLIGSIWAAGCVSEAIPVAEVRTLDSLAGVVYDPATPAEYLSSTPLKFEGTAEIGGRPVELTGDFTSWIVGASFRGPGASKEAVAANCKPAGAGGSVECPIFPVRLGQFGRLDGPQGLSWMLDIDLKPGEFSGVLRSTLQPDGSLAYPAEVRFSLPLTFLTQEEGKTEVQKHRSRQPAVFEGKIDGWPQGLMVISLTNGPVSFFREGEAQREDAKPHLVLKAGTFAFADKPSEFFRRQPKILSAEVVDASGSPWSRGEIGGLSLRWTGSAQEILSSVVNGYHIYRNLSPARLGGWERIASVPGNQTSFVDSTYEGTEAAYLVVHAMEYPFDLKYEGIYGPATPVRPVAR